MSEQEIRWNARILMRLVTVPLCLLVLLAVVLAGNVVKQGGGPWVPFMLIYYTPLAFYIAAILMVRSALARIASGDLFAAVLPSLFFRTGAALLIGSLFKEFGVPLLTWIVSGAPYIRPFEPSAITLGIVGALLLVVGQLLGKASTAQDELGQFV